MTRDDATQALEGSDLAGAAQGSFLDMKSLLGRCLDADIPATLLVPPGKSCGPQAVLLVKEPDVVRVHELLHTEWQRSVAQEGGALTAFDPAAYMPTVGGGGCSSGACAPGSVAGAGVQAGAPPDDGTDTPPCPCCGCRLPLADGACADCGLGLS